jgi:hypothetical protein
VADVRTALSLLAVSRAIASVPFVILVGAQCLGADVPPSWLPVIHRFSSPRYFNKWRKSGNGKLVSRQAPSTCVNSTDAGCEIEITLIAVILLCEV